MRPKLKEGVKTNLYLDVQTKRDLQWLAVYYRKRSMAEMVEDLIAEEMAKPEVIAELSDEEKKVRRRGAHKSPTRRR